MTKAGKKTKKPLNKAMLPIVALIVTTLSFLFIVKFTLLNQQKSTNQTQPGITIPSFQLHPTEGKPVFFSDLGKKVVLINFWAAWCESCLSEMPSIIALRKKYLRNNFDVVFVNLDENPKSVIPSISKQMGIDFTQYVDKNGTLTDLFSVFAIPFTVILDNQRKILYTESGDRDWNSKEVQKKVETWLSL